MSRTEDTPEGRGATPLDWARLIFCSASVAAGAALGLAGQADLALAVTAVATAVAAGDGLRVSVRIGHPSPRGASRPRGKSQI
ncbi:hypothetical protein C0R05_31785 [Streptomyces albidoflavus]|nr:hypothetical protein C0R05_31785 [Streptomyces albidoflavus]